MQMVASPKIATSQAQSTSSLTPQAAQEAHALANASETLKAQAQTLKVCVTLQQCTATLICHGIISVCMTTRCRASLGLPPSACRICAKPELLACEEFSAVCMPRPRLKPRPYVNYIPTATPGKKAHCLPFCRHGAFFVNAEGVRLAVQAHAENLHAQSYQAVSQPAHMQVAAKAQSLATHAQSLEAQAEAQNLQAQAHVHAHAHAEAQAQAQHLAAQAQAHAQAQAQANAHATHLKSAASFGTYS